MSRSITISPGDSGTELDAILKTSNRGKLGNTESWEIVDSEDETLFKVALFQPKGRGPWHVWEANYLSPERRSVAELLRLARNTESAPATPEDLLSDPRYFERHRAPKWNIEPTVVEEPKLFRKVFPELTKAHHHQRAIELFGRSLQTERALSNAIRKADAQYGKVDPNDPNDHEYRFISGGFKAHWPSQVKDEIRGLNQRLNLENGASLAHWIASGRKPKDWRKMKEAKR